MQIIYLFGFLLIAGLIISILTSPIFWIIIGIAVLVIIITSINSIHEANQKAEQRAKEEKEYQELKNEALNDLGLSSWPVVSCIEKQVTVKSRQALTNYDIVKFFKENKPILIEAEGIINKKNNIAVILRTFLANNKYKSHIQYPRLQKQINEILKNTNAYRVKVKYISSAGNNLGEKVIIITQQDINKFKNNPSLLMTKEELNKQNKNILDEKQQEYYKKINNIITYANDNKDALIIKNFETQLDNLITELFDKVATNVKKSRLLIVKNGALLIT